MQFRKQRPAMVHGKNVILQQDNAGSHTAKVTQQKIRDLDWKTLAHPPCSYNLQLASSDLQIFRSLQQFADGTNFPIMKIPRVEYKRILMKKQGIFVKETQKLVCKCFMYDL